jgi:uncharacterized protein (TIGR02145 family)
MKQLAVLLFIDICTNVFSQAPQSIPYQAIVRNTDGIVLSNTPLTMTFKIHDVSATGTVVFEEDHTTASNAQGLVALKVGGGTPITGTFNTINWGNGAKFLHVLMNAGNDVVDLGTQQMLSVPYALYANDITLRVSLTGDSLFIGDQVSIVPGVSEANVPPLFTDGSGAIDSQGNSYNTIVIGDQEWFSGYLKSDYFTYGKLVDMHDLGQCFSNDSLIPMISDYWTIDGKWALQDSIFGHNYNISALTHTTKNICPIGWRVPTSHDVKILLKSIKPQYDTSYNEVTFTTDELNTFWNSLGWKTVDNNYNNSWDSYYFDTGILNMNSMGIDLYHDWYLRDNILLNVNDTGLLSFQTITSNFVNVTANDTYYQTKCVLDNESIKYGCTDANACNFHPWADENNESCYSIGDECDDKNGNTTYDQINENCDCVGIRDTLPGVLNCGEIEINGCDGDSSITYFGINYDLIEVGGQCWFANDLKTLLKNDGSFLEILESTDYCHDASIPAVYTQETLCGHVSAVYNRAAVIDDNICPTGWHVPTECEWKYLFAEFGAETEELNSNEFGCSNNVLGSMISFRKNCGGEVDDVVGTKNKNGFNALPNLFGVEDNNTFSIEWSDPNALWWWYGSESYFYGLYFIRSLSYYPSYPSYASTASYCTAVRCVKGNANIAGCMDVSACNFNIYANHDDGSCLHLGEACNDSTLQTINDIINDACECVGQLIIDNPVNQGNGVTDIDGNVYSTVVIGNQEWMSENLKTTTFRNGDEIKQFTSVGYCLWSDLNYTLRMPTYLINNNEMINNSIYGKMYNFYAANDPRGVCPAGWRLPNDSDMYELVDYITPLSPIITDIYGQRYSSFAGGKLKAINEWSSPNEGATNEFGFSALPGGGINVNVNGNTIQYYSGISSSWWLISPEYNQNSTIETDYIDRYFSMWHSSAILNLNYSNSFTSPAYNNAHFIRCIKD